MITKKIKVASLLCGTLAIIPLTCTMMSCKTEYKVKCLEDTTKNSSNKFSVEELKTARFLDYVDHYKGFSFRTLKVNGEVYASIVGRYGEHPIGDIIIPEEVEDSYGTRYQVIAIGDRRFTRPCSWGVEKGKPMIKMNKNILFIYDWAFYHVTDKFSILLGTNVIGIGIGAFKGCYNLEAFSFKSNRVEYLGEEAFYGASLLRIPTFHKLKHISDSAFSSVNIFGDNETLNFDDWCELISIGSSAFKSTYLYSVNFSKKIESIGHNAFEDAGLDIIDFKIHDSNLFSIGHEAFKYINCEPDADGIILKLPNSLQVLYDDSFYYGNIKSCKKIITPCSVIESNNYKLTNIQYVIEDYDKKSTLLTRIAQDLIRPMTNDELSDIDPDNVIEYPIKATREAN